MLDKDQIRQTASEVRQIVLEYRQIAARHTADYACIWAYLL
jgi:hypothetical protein